MAEPMRLWVPADDAPTPTPPSTTASTTSSSTINVPPPLAGSTSMHRLVHIHGQPMVDVKQSRSHSVTIPRKQRTLRAMTRQLKRGLLKFRLRMKPDLSDLAPEMIQYILDMLPLSTRLIFGQTAKDYQTQSRESLRYLFRVERDDPNREVKMYNIRTIINNITSDADELSTACLYGQSKYVDVLLENHRSNLREYVNRPNSDGTPPLIIAINSFPPPIVQRVLGGILHDSPSPYETVLYQANLLNIPMGNAEIVNKLITAGADIKWEGGYPLMEASIYGNIPVLMLLIKAGADVNASDGVALYTACLYGQTEVVKVLLKEGAAVATYIQSLQAAINATGDVSMRKRIEIVQILLAAGTRVNLENSTVLVDAIEVHNDELVKLIIDSGADIRVDDDAPLIMAANRGHTEIVRILIAAAGANLNEENAAILRRDYVNLQNGKALALASYGGHREIVIMLLNAGADSDGDDGLPLENAAGQGFTQLVNLLIERGAHVNANAGAALCAAVRNERVDIVRILLAAGADATIADNLPLRIALLMGFLEIQDILRAAGAQVNF